MTRLSGTVYEDFVKKIVETFGKQLAIRDIRGGRSNKIVGASSVPHQVDVSFIDTDTSPPTLVLVECKGVNNKDKKKRKVKLADVKVLSATIEDVKAHAPSNPGRVIGILVSTKPAQPAAGSFATHYGIDLQIVSDRPPWSFSYRGCVNLIGEESVTGAGDLRPSTAVPLGSLEMKTSLGSRKK